MPDAYLVALVLATGLFIFIVVQRLRAGKSIPSFFGYIPFLLGAAWVCYRMWADGQKIGRLTSEVEKAREKEKDATMAIATAEIETEKKALEKQLAQAENQTLALEEKLKMEEDRHAKAVERARGIESWDDFWAAVGSGDEGPPEADPRS